MAWDQFEQDDLCGTSGDKPLDELTLALNRIVKAYQERFFRNCNPSCYA